MVNSYKFQQVGACPACAGARRDFLFPIEGSSVFQCAKCDLKYLSPCLDQASMVDVYESNDSLKTMHSFHEGYYDYGDVQTPSATRTEFTTALEKLEDLLGPRPSKSLFDVGFGNGFFLALAKQRGWTVDGIDSSVQNKEKAKSRYQLDLASGSFHAFSSGAKKYDAVSFWDVVEHLPQPDVFLAKAKSLLKPGGVMVIAVPNDKSLMALIASLLYKMTFRQFKFALRKLYFLEHVSYFHLEALKTLLERNGFQYRAHFTSSTDLHKFKLPWTDKILSSLLLSLGKLVGMQNRLVSFYTVKP